MERAWLVLRSTANDFAVGVVLAIFGLGVAGVAIFLLVSPETRVAGASLLGGLVVAAGTARTVHTTREGQITDRFAKAIGQLGSEVEDVRLGGIYALERIARDSRRDHQTVIEVLTAYVRKRAPWPGDPNAGYLAGHTPENDIQAAIAVLGRRVVRPRELRMDLSSADLRGVKFAGDFGNAILRGSNLEGAELREADLRGVEDDEKTKWPEGVVREAAPARGAGAR
jgi:hypothetical protein